MWQPFAFAWRLESNRKNDREQYQDRNDAEIELPQLLFIDLTGERRQLRAVLQMPIYGLTTALRLREQMWRIWWCNSLRSEMTPDIQVGGIFPLLNCLMM